jgi:hypothetical protein
LVLAGRQALVVGLHQLRLLQQSMPKLVAAVPGISLLMRHKMSVFQVQVAAEVVVL